MVGVNAIVGVSVMVEIRVSVSVKVFVGVRVNVGVVVAAGMEAMSADVAALAEETTWVITNSKPTRAATIPREASDLLK